MSAVSPTLPRQQLPGRSRRSLPLPRLPRVNSTCSTSFTSTLLRPPLRATCENCLHELFTECCRGEADCLRGGTTRWRLPPERYWLRKRRCTAPSWPYAASPRSSCAPLRRSFDRLVLGDLRAARERRGSLPLSRTQMALSPASGRAIEVPRDALSRRSCVGRERAITQFRRFHALSLCQRSTAWRTSLTLRNVSIAAAPLSCGSGGKSV